MPDLQTTGRIAVVTRRVYQALEALSDHDGANIKPDLEKLELFAKVLEGRLAEERLNLQGGLQ